MSTYMINKACTHLTIKADLTLIVIADVNDFILVKLWRAPEYLNTPKHTGSQTGDIYSVGIVLQEIICEDCPYPNCHYSTQEIIEKVPFGFRPKITHQHASSSFVDLVER